MRLIDADALETHEQLEPMGNGQYEYVEVVYKDDIDDAPTIDAVEVVRCGRCEWWKCNPNTEEYGVCKKVSYDDFEVVMDSDDFCSYEKVREDGEE